MSVVDLRRQFTWNTTCCNVSGQLHTTVQNKNVLSVTTICPCLSQVLPDVRSHSCRDHAGAADRWQRCVRLRWMSRRSIIYWSFTCLQTEGLCISTNHVGGVQLSLSFHPSQNHRSFHCWPVKKTWDQHSVLVYPPLLTASSFVGCCSFQLIRYNKLSDGVKMFLFSWDVKYQRPQRSTEANRSLFVYSFFFFFFTFEWSKKFVLQAMATHVQWSMCSQKQKHESFFTKFFIKHILGFPFSALWPRYCSSY